VATSLSKFKTQYPEGGLVAELISIHDGQCIVRAVASNQGITIGSGLASSVDVQIAEDKARDRALAVLGIFADSAQADRTPAKSAPIVQKAELTVEKESAKEPVPSATPSVLGRDQGEPPQPDNELLTVVDLEEAVAEETEDLGPPIDEVAEEPIAPSEGKVSAAVIALENFNTSAVPVDLSDVIAQTDVELTRLGWTNDQGREYLEKTYGKRSRRQLNDEELMSFLLYLEEQP